MQILHPCICHCWICTAVADFCPKVLGCPRHRCESCTKLNRTGFPSINVLCLHLRRRGQTVVWDGQTRFEACLLSITVSVTGMDFWNILALFQIVSRFQVFLWKWCFLKAINMCMCALASLAGGKGNSVSLHHWKDTSCLPWSARCSAVQVTAAGFDRVQDARLWWLLLLHALSEREHGSARAVLHCHSLGQHKIVINLSG